MASRSLRLFNMPDKGGARQAAISQILQNGLEKEPFKIEVGVQRR